MIASLKGLISSKTTAALTIDVSGIGYEVFVPLSTFYQLPNEKEIVSLYVHTHVREDSFQLFGFKTLLEKKLFLLLVSVSGVGPKLALNILSGIETSELVVALREGQMKRLKSIPGVGPKMAGRLALELREKADQFEMDDVKPTDVITNREDSVRSDALSALINLGYKQPDAKRAIDLSLKGCPDAVSVEMIIREGLKKLSKVS